MAQPLVCKCGQTLDITSFEPGRQVRCPSCQEVLTVPELAARPESPPPPVVAMAMAVDDEESGVQPAAVGRGGRGGRGGGGRRLDPMARRKMAARRSAYAAQSRLKKFMIWPSLALGLASLAVAVMGFVWLFAPKEIELLGRKDPTTGVEVMHLYARVEKTPGSKKYERIEIQPDIYPGDSTNGDDFTLNGAKPAYHGGAWIVNVGGKEVAVQRRGLWFYELDMSSDKNPKPVIRKVDVPLVAYTRTGRGDDAVYTYLPVKWQGAGFVDPRSGNPVKNVSYYRIDENGVQDMPIQGRFEEQMKPFLGLSPVFYIVSGLGVGALLLMAAVFFAWETYFSAAAKKQREKQRQQSAARSGS